MCDPGNPDKVVCYTDDLRTDERCNGEDDDCDGRTDEDWPDLGQPCGLGECEGGVSICPDDELEALTACSTDVNAEVEVCDGFDNDCDGLTDDDDPDVIDRPVWHPDEDGDGFGDERAEPTEACEPPDKHVPDGTDCDDDDEDIHPDEIEVCDGVDNNCNGDTDEGDMPLPADPCGQEGGDCSIGQWMCDPDVNDWTCEGAIWPQNEVCDGRDNDCDGTADNDPAFEGDDCDLTPGCDREAFRVCEGGRMRCVADGEPPAEDQCDGVDDDCDGRTDEDWVPDAGQCPPLHDAQGCLEVQAHRCLAGEDQALCELVDRWCENTADTCTDTADNDQDGLTDCEDPNCQGLAVCDVAVENNAQLCNDGIDNDGDASVDCNDVDCANVLVGCIGQGCAAQVLACNWVGDPDDECDAQDHNADGFNNEHGRCRQNRWCYGNASVADLPADRLEDNDAIAAAEPLDAGRYADLSVHPGDPDYYRLPACQPGGLIVVRVLFNHDHGDIALNLRSGAGALLATSKRTTTTRRSTTPSMLQATTSSRSISSTAAEARGTSTSSQSRPSTAGR